MRNGLVYVFLLLGSLVAGCSNYLDVVPKDKQTQEQLFATRSGFYAAVNGIYNRLALDALYGRNMSYEMIDLLALRYSPTVSTGTMVAATLSWDYTNSYLKSTISTVWSSAYQTILNCNVVLDNLDKQQEVLTEEEARLIRGEMLAVRAFLHFDMLRMFGPMYAENPKAEAIPYNESIKVMNLPLLAADSVLEYRILRDLNAAEQYLVADPVVEGGPMASADEEGGEAYLRYRQLRFNYYAVLALKARVLLYAGNRSEAREAALRLLDDPAVKSHFPSVDPARLLGNSQTPDRVFSTEVLMGIYKNNRADIFTYSFDDENVGSVVLKPKNNYIVNNLFAGETADYRYQSQWGTGSFVKYKKLIVSDENNLPFYARLMPLIRLSEMYYIVAECEKELSERYDRLNEIRGLRGVPALPVVSEEDFTQRLRTEYLREFYGEGQLFFMFKRMGTTLTSSENGYNNNSYALTAVRFVVPLPEDEIAYR